MTKALMFMGTGSDVGKSLIVAGLCRVAANRGLSVAPFKPQNMSNNAAVTSDGGEIGRAQALQARAARRDPITAMNPVLLKPEYHSGAQVVVRGQRVASMPARQYFAERQRFMEPILEAFEDLGQSADLIVVEGAGSASEVNLRQNDIANFGFAEAARVPVVLIGDIERGGVIASLVGTFSVVQPSDAQRIVATLINKFQGDPALFVDGQAQIANQTGRPSFGPVPYFDKAHLLPAEDILGLQSSPRSASESLLKIAVPRLPRISNFDDLDPLQAEPDVAVEIIKPGHAIPRDADLIILPGSKSTIADLQFLKEQGWDIDISAHVRTGGHVLGMCGGYQMLGTSLSDPLGLEGDCRDIAGLGLLNVETTLGPAKQLRIEEGVDTRFKQQLTGYHMHLGETKGPDFDQPFALIDGKPEGAIAKSGRVMGTYLHGIFSSDTFRRAFLKDLGAVGAMTLNYETQVEETLDLLANHLEAHLDIDALFALAAPIGEN